MSLVRTAIFCSDITALVSQSDMLMADVPSVHVKTCSSCSSLGSGPSCRPVGPGD